MIQDVVVIARMSDLIQGFGIIGIFLLFGSNCTPKDPPGYTDKTLPHSLKQLRIEDGAGLLFSFVDRTGQLRTVDMMTSIDIETRSAVMVTAPGVELPKATVIIADLSKKTDAGHYNFGLKPKAEWLDLILPKLSIVDTHKIEESVQPDALTHSAARKPPKTLARRTSKRKPRTPKTVGADARSSANMVTIYTTTWCPACKTARAFFAKNHISYTDKNVEQDPVAARKMLSIQRDRGFKTGAVPLIIINGSAYQGFSELQMTSALARYRSR